MTAREDTMCARCIVRAAVPALLLVSASLAFLYATLPDYFAYAAGGDSHEYARLAVSLGDCASPPPWKYRILFPALAGAVHQLGVPLPIAFLCVTWVAACLGCILCVRFLAALGFSAFSSAAGAALFAATCGGLLSMRGYMMPDTLTYVFALGALICIVAGRPYRAMWIVSLAVLAKESALMILPTAFVFNRSIRSWRGLLGMCALPLSVYAMVRVLLPAGQGFNYFSAENVGNVAAYWRGAMAHGAPRWILGELCYSLGPLWLLAAVYAPDAKQFLKLMVLYAIPLVLPLFLTADTDRALALFFPIVIPLAVCGVESLRRVDARRATAWAVALVLAAFVAQSLHYVVSAWKYPVAAAACLLPGLAGAWARFRGIPGAAGFRLGLEPPAR